MTSFVYIWEDTKYGMKYIGAHKGTPDDGYVSSSKSFMEIYEKRPQDFKRVIVANCDTFENALHQEALLCKAVGAAQNPEYYNLHNGDGKFFSTNIKYRARRISEGKKGKPITEAQRLGYIKAAASRKAKDHGWWSRGKKYSAEHREKLRQSHLGIIPSDETRQKKSEINKMKGIKPPNQAGTFWWNDGMNNKRSKDSPGAGWIKGRLKNG